MQGLLGDPGNAFASSVFNAFSPLTEMPDPLSFLMSVFFLRCPRGVSVFGKGTSFPFSLFPSFVERSLFYCSLQVLETFRLLPLFLGRGFFLFFSQSQPPPPGVINVPFFFFPLKVPRLKEKIPS